VGLNPIHLHRLYIWSSRWTRLWGPPSLFLLNQSLKFRVLSVQWRHLDCGELCLHPPYFFVITDNYIYVLFSQQLFPRQVHQIKFSVYFPSLRSCRPSPSHYCHQPLFLRIPRGSQTKAGVLFARHGMLSVHTHLLATSPRVLLLFSLFRRASIQPRQCQSLHPGLLSD